MKKQTIVSVSIFTCAALAFAATALANFTPPPVPTDPSQCKDDGWRSYGDMFKNQGDCVSFVVTDGRNAPDGPPIH